jgi:type I restriction enzyme M protein
LAQYFTPPTLTEFIVEFLNPQWNQDVHDPACGSADFLTAAFRRGQSFPDYASRIWGTDVSPEAAQVAILNMVLNGDGKSNILVRDSLKEVSANKNKWDIVVCNPPFGVRIVERSSDTIKKFDLGHKMELVNDDWQTTDEILKTQETGILFAELCVKLARPETGRIALVVPNGYLGNRSPKYHQLRSFLLRHTRIAAMVALPRFTFKGSGADVSASVIFLEKRAKPLARISDVESYDIAVQVIDRVGWNTGDKKGAPAYKRDPSDGTFVLDDDSDMILDSDFEGALRRLRLSDSNQDFEWFTKNIDGLDTVGHHDSDAWSVDSLEIVSDRYQTLDPKRLGKKFKDVVAVIEKVDHFRLGDVVDFVPERQFSDGQMLRIKPEQTYEYVELQNVEAGTYRRELSIQRKPVISSWADYGRASASGFSSAKSMDTHWSPTGCIA